MANIQMLSNGIQVFLDPMPHYQSVAVGLWVRVGSAFETRVNNGMSHMVEHMLFKGTKVRSAKDIADEMTEIGGFLDAYTTKEFTCYYTRTLDIHLKKALDIMSDMILNAVIDEEELKKEQGVILEEIDMYEDDPDELVHEQLVKKIWRGYPIGYDISGEKEIIKNFSRSDVCQFKEKHYNSSNIVISIAGNMNVTDTYHILEEKFADIRPGIKNEAYNQPEYHQSFVVKHKDVEQTYLNMAYRSVGCKDDRKYTLAILNNILGGNMNSRLFQEIREDRGLAYSIDSYGNSYLSCGLLHINAAMCPNQLEEVFTAILKVIKHLKQDKIIPKELSISKEQLKTEIIIGNESTKSRMEAGGKHLMYDKGMITTKEMLNHIDEVTIEDIMDFTREYFTHEELSISLVGDTSLINTQIIKDMLNE